MHHAPERRPVLAPVWQQRAYEQVRDQKGQQQEIPAKSNAALFRQERRDF
jgi:hypothetical protein